MRDFTLKQYNLYLSALIDNGYKFVRFDEYIEKNLDGNNFALLRHDVDRRPKNSLNMAKLEHDLGVKATYYFRAKPCSYDEKIIKEIANLGHEIGYHYECLSDVKGDYDQAYALFEKSLNSLRVLVPVKTISMHGRPLSPIDNRDMWKTARGKELLNKHELLGEIYFAIDYSHIAYIGDTGRNWNTKGSNLRDHVESEITVDLDSKDELLEYFKTVKNSVVFQVHPERWDDDLMSWSMQYAKDSFINVVKFGIRLLR